MNPNYVGFIGLQLQLFTLCKQLAELYVQQIYKPSLVGRVGGNVEV